MYSEHNLPLPSSSRLRTFERTNTLPNTARTNTIGPATTTVFFADAEGEGMITAEFVMRDRRPDHYVVRASKVLATQDVMGNKYQLKYQTPEQVMRVLDSIPVAIVVMQRCPIGRCGQHENLLNEAATLYPERWRLSSVVPSEQASPILVYQIIGNETKTVQTLQLDMIRTLGTTIDSR